MDLLRLDYFRLDLIHPFDESTDGSDISSSMSSWDSDVLMIRSIIHLNDIPSPSLIASHSILRKPQNLFGSLSSNPNSPLLKDKYNLQLTVENNYLRLTVTTDISMPNKITSNYAVFA